MTTEQLLDVPLHRLGVALEGSWVESIVQRLYAELEAKGLSVRPTVYLSDEWCAPDNLVAIAVPFYLVHPRLKKLERQMMLEVEGDTPATCMRLMRHEAGHAIQNAFQLHRRRSFRELFGSSSKPYPDFYRPNPRSKRFVQYLPGWYAQSHPAEDFAETFAVWLDPRSAWARSYAGWPALAKLEYVDALMQEVAGQPSKLRSRARPYRLGTLKYTLREYYSARQQHYQPAIPEELDRDLERLFAPRGTEGVRAEKYIRLRRKELRASVARWTGEHLFSIDRVLELMIDRVKALGLVVEDGTDPDHDLAVLLTVQSLDYLHNGRSWHAV